MSFNCRRSFWVLWFLTLVLAAFIVPYTLLTSIASPYGAFLFWNLFALAAIISVAIMTAGWRD